LIDIAQITRTLEVFKGELIEIRSVGSQPMSGYYRDATRLLADIKKRPNETYYFVLNSINEACYSRDQSEKLVVKPKAATSDNDIDSRAWILVDADPARASGVSATDAEKEKALHTSRRIYAYLRNTGFTDPVVADSGNGYHLLYRAHMTNTPQNTDLVKSFLQALDMLFSDEHVSIDTSVYNAARITKLYGVMASKGANTPERPHRQSKLLSIPEALAANSAESIKKVAALVPKPETPNYNKTFEIDAFLAKHGIHVAKTSSCSQGTKYVLEECVFDSSHKAPDAAIIALNSGALSYHCFHNSCQNYRWQDVRLKFEPGAYNPKEQPARITRPQPLMAQSVAEQGAPKFLKLTDITQYDRSQIVSVPSGIHALDKRLIGFNKGELSVWSGGNGSGKSTMMSMIALESINRGFRVAMFSGELTDKRMKNWLHLQAAGKLYNKSTEHEGVYYTPKETGEKIDRWAGEKLWLYNNDYGSNAAAVLADIKAHIEQHNTDVVIIDNLMSLDLSDVPGDKWDKQSVIALALAEMAKRRNVHVHFICHPRKPTGFLRKADISGTADLTNAADNVFMMHRVNSDFIRLSKEFYDKGKAEQYFNYTNVLEVMKNRDLGVEDTLIGLFFERESKRLLNAPDERRTYNWQDVQMSNFGGIKTNTSEEKDADAESMSLWWENV